MKALVGALNQEKALVKYCKSMNLPGSGLVSVQGLVHAYKIFAFRYVLVLSVPGRLDQGKPQEMELF